MNVMKLKYPGSIVDRSALIPIYDETSIAHKRLFGSLGDEDAERKLTKLWDQKKPQGKVGYEEFYYDNDLMPQELINWYQRSNYQRINRAIYAGGIARGLGLRTFAEFGCGPGADLAALSFQKFVPVWACDINTQGLSIARELSKKYIKGKVKIFNSIDERVEDQAAADFLYSSDVFEHIYNLEEMLTPWIHKFRAVIVYAPFGSNKEQHQHTSYSAERFHSFMEKIGFNRVVYNLGVPPYVYLKFSEVVKIISRQRKDALK